MSGRKDLEIAEMLEVIERNREFRHFNLDFSVPVAMVCINHSHTFSVGFPLTGARTTARSAMFLFGGGTMLLFACATHLKLLLEVNSYLCEDINSNLT